MTQEKPQVSRSRKHTDWRLPSVHACCVML